MDSKNKSILRCARQLAGEVDIFLSTYVQKEDVQEHTMDYFSFSLDGSNSFIFSVFYVLFS